MEAQLTSEIERYIRDSLRTNLVGFAGIERFEGAPRGHHPADILPGARTVITYGVPWPASLVHYTKLFKDSELMPERLVQEPPSGSLWAQSQTYNPRVAEGNTWFTRYAYDWPNIMMQTVAWNLYRWLEDLGYLTIPVPASTGGWGTRLAHVPGRSSFSHRHAAVAAGLGELGYQGLLLAPRYGPNLRLCSVITRAELSPSPQFEGTLCLGEKCARCIQVCPNHAYSEERLTYKIGVRETMQRKFLRSKCHVGIEVYCGECQFCCPVDERLREMGWE